MLPQADQEPETAVISIRRRTSFWNPRNWRGLMAVLVAVMYLLSCAP